MNKAEIIARGKARKGQPLKTTKIEPFNPIACVFAKYAEAQIISVTIVPRGAVVVFLRPSIAGGIEHRMAYVHPERGVQSDMFAE